MTDTNTTYNSKDWNFEICSSFFFFFWSVGSLDTVTIWTRPPTPRGLVVPGILLDSVHLLVDSVHPRGHHGWVPPLDGHRDALEAVEDDLAVILPLRPRHRPRHSLHLLEPPPRDPPQGVEADWDEPVACPGTVLPVLPDLLDLARPRAFTMAL